MTSAQVRKLLTDRLPTDADFDAFCIDTFPDSHRRFTGGMDRTARINLLLELHGAQALSSALSNGSRQTSTSQRVFHVPQQLSPHFTGRDQFLQEVREQVSAKRAVALWGLGGIGKTQAALEFAGRYRNDYGGVLWITGDSTAGLEQGLFELARPLATSGRVRADLLDERDPAAVRQVVVDHLRQSTDYLLICDNVDAPLSLRHVWPRNLGGQVLFTSRSQDVRRLGAVVMELGRLSDEESRDYLMRSQAASGPEEELALRELVRELQGLPLALAQAAAYVTRHRSRYDAYLRGYRKKKLGLLEQGLPDEDYPFSIATTWAMSMEQVEKSNTASLALLKLCALLQPDAIPEELFRGAVDELDEPLRSTLRADDDDEQALDSLLEPLLCHALMQRDPANRMLSVHRLVQQAVLHRLSPEEQRRLGRAAVLQVNRAFPKETFDFWPQCRRLLPQVEVLSEHIRRGSLSDSATGRLLATAGEFLKDQAQYREAEPLIRQSLEVRQQALGPEHPEVADSLNKLAMLLRAQGHLEQAEQVCRDALNLREKTLGRDHHDVSESLNDLAIVLDDLGRFDESEPLYYRSLAIRERNLGPDHPEVGTCLNNLGWLLHAMGRLEDSEPMCRRAIQIYERAYGPDHPDVSYPMHLLGAVLLDQGKLADAEPLLRRALAIRENTLPPGHPRIEQSRKALDSLSDCRLEGRPPLGLAGEPH